MRRRIIFFVVAGLAIWGALEEIIHGADLPYSFQTVNISVPRCAACVAWPDDINDSGVIIATSTGLQDIVVVGNPTNARQSKFRPQTFGCPDVLASAINAAGQIAGYCAGGAFVRQPNGQIDMLAGVPAEAAAWGIGSDGTVVGQYYVPGGVFDPGGTYHGFTWHPVNGYRTIDFPGNIQGAGIRTQTALYGMDAGGRILGEYRTEQLGVDTLEHGYFIYDNGFFDTTAFPKSFEYQGGPTTLVVDYNDSGQAVVVRSGDGLPVRTQLYDDGAFFDIPTPEGWINVGANGMNNLGAFVGTYLIQSGVDPVHGNAPVYKRHGFIATPAPVMAARKK